MVKTGRKSPYAIESYFGRFRRSRVNFQFTHRYLRFDSVVLALQSTTLRRIDFSRVPCVGLCVFCLTWTHHAQRYLHPRFFRALRRPDSTRHRHCARVEGVFNVTAALADDAAMMLEAFVLKVDWKGTKVDIPMREGRRKHLYGTTCFSCPLTCVGYMRS